MPPIRIIIAENCYSYAMILKDYISAVHMDIAVIGIAENGLKALNMVRRMKPDALLLDIVMPNLDGLQVLERIRKVDKQTLVYMMSALNNEEIISKAMGLGADHYFTKPIDIDAMAAMLKESVWGKLTPVQ